MINEVITALSNESALIAHAQTDPAAFQAVFEFYFARVYNYVRYRVYDHQTADDLTADIFETVLVKLHTYRPERGPFAPWLFTIARNTVNYHRRKQKIRQWFSLDHFYHLAGKDPGPDDVAGQNETRHRLLRAVNQLSEREKELIALKFSAGLTNRAIAQMTGYSESNVAVILHRALKRLRHMMDAHEV